mmetsp:Transcript_14453/g.23765  ORF Transcript_14453/g.23765 Transcript_14453/m.23765 type:complete len:206 (-) Transcript_14453:884-1501(-)
MPRSTAPAALPTTWATPSWRRTSHSLARCSGGRRHSSLDGSVLSITQTGSSESWSARSTSRSTFPRRPRAPQCHWWRLYERQWESAWLSSRGCRTPRAPKPWRRWRASGSKLATQTSGSITHSCRSTPRRPTTQTCWRRGNSNLRELWRASMPRWIKACGSWHRSKSMHTTIPCSTRLCSPPQSCSRPSFLLTQIPLSTSGLLGL